jgi:hypothetical protein
MKRISILPALFILITIGCRKSNSPTNQLPPETHDGDNTMGCYVDNKLFIPQEPFLSNLGGYSGAAILNAPSFDLVLNWTDDISNSDFTSVSIQLDSVQLIQGATYTLGAPPDSMTDQTSHKVWATYINWVQYQFYYTAGEGTGQVTIDYYDPTVSVATGIVSGHFSFDAVNSNNDTVHVSEGRFDMALQMR